MEYSDYLETGTMPPVGTLDPEEERRKREAAAAGTRMPPVMLAQPSSAPSAANTMPPVPVASAPRSDASRTPAFSADAVRAAMDTIRGNAAPMREALAPDSREFFQSAVTSARPQAGGTADASEGTPRNTMPAVPYTGRARDLAVGATVQPKIQPPRMQEASAPEIAGPSMPPVPLPTAKSPAAPTLQPGAMPPVPIGPAQQRFEDLAKQGPPQPKFWQRALEIAGSVAPFGLAIEKQLPSTPIGYNAALNKAALAAAREQMLGKREQEAETARAQAQFNTPEKRRAYMQQNPDLFDDVSDFEKHDWVLSGKFPQKEPAAEKTTDKKIDEYVNDKGQRVLTFQRADNSTYDKVGGQTQPKPAGHTSAFEAFAYGSPEEKKAAQDYLEFEKKLGARYRTPSEFDERYRLFKEDPETYKAMFGDKGGTPDRATATKMLNYFDRRRREINQDFTLDDAQKQEQLQDIENLEKPFMDAVQPGAGGDRVKVIHPNGTVGTIPRSQLPAAKKKGYREAQ